MARKTARPGRTVVVFFLGLAIAYGLVALGGTWKPSSAWTFRAAPGSR